MNPPSAIELAGQYQTARYILTAVVTAYAYDWVLSIQQEQALVAKFGLTRSNVVYFFSRTTSLAVQACSTSFSLAVASDCGDLMYANSALSLFSITSTYFLFLLRARAVYQNSDIATVVFGANLIVLIGLYIYQLVSFHADHIAHSSRCSSQQDYLLLIPIISLCATDTLVFLAISYRLAGLGAGPNANWSERARRFVTGDGLHSLGRSLLRSGQVYYLATILFFFINLALVLTPAVPAVLRYILVPPYVSFTNVMTCRVFRGLKLGTIQDEDRVGVSTRGIEVAFGIGVGAGVGSKGASADGDGRGQTDSNSNAGGSMGDEATVV
ncbi:hypothetical protein FIBSPDRAFT_959527 [Athelia psychrophila]|uniref:DUF6533 domain-containing protein n=1 Tax=Athelia psychrophila TaxID=1759441 RepID=A0A166DCY0_9AGAM|nr:hypothetical protein FIBSPDRAFT_959523 [Fibularhizoctonia sp. CBS 109695]KZP14573.1 hypothetical protein FIBSPDRAFT_959527 [Fibularhizoctonia sp. CBS 109695]